MNLEQECNWAGSCAHRLGGWVPPPHRLSSPWFSPQCRRLRPSLPIPCASSASLAPSLMALPDQLQVAFIWAPGFFHIWPCQSTFNHRTCICSSTFWCTTSNRHAWWTTWTEQDYIGSNPKEGMNVRISMVKQTDGWNIMKGREPEWSNPQIEDGLLPAMPKNKVTFCQDKVVKFQSSAAPKHIVGLFPNWQVGMYISWVRLLWLSALNMP